MATAATIRTARYDRTHTKSYYFKFNLATDADIIEKLDGVENRQAYIKQLIREDMERQKAAPEGMKAKTVTYYEPEWMPEPSKETIDAMKRHCPLPNLRT